MRINGREYRTIWFEDGVVKIIDQRWLPFQFEIEVLSSGEDVERAIAEMHVRGAPLIGVTGAYGVALLAEEYARGGADICGRTKNEFLARAEKIAKARPTAVNLRWAVNQQLELFELQKTWSDAASALFKNAARLADEDVDTSRRIGEAGVEVFRELFERKKGEPLNVMTHCNAGWLATIDYGTATAPMYLAHRAGVPIHVWVSETRPRLQGAKITAFELHHEGIPHTVIPDGASAHLIQRGLVDVCIVGTDRTTRTGDVANKIGTYSKALACHEHQVPFYVAAPSSSIDWDISDGIQDIEIEERGAVEVSAVMGDSRDMVPIANPESAAKNFGFDVTPAKLVSGLVTERGVCAPVELVALFDKS